MSTRGGRALVSAVVLVLSGSLLAGCSGEDPDPGGASDAVSKAARADVAAVAEKGVAFLDAFETYEEVVNEFVQQGPATLDTAPLEDGVAAYDAASSDYRSAVSSLDFGDLEDDPAVASAEADYQAQVRATVASRDATIRVGTTYGFCDIALEAAILKRSGHDQVADVCLDLVGPLRSSEYPVVSSYAEAMTKMMNKRKQIFARVAKVQSQTTTVGPDPFDPDKSRQAGDSFRALGDAVRRGSKQLTAAFDVFLPSLERLYDGGGLQRLHAASSPDRSRATLLAVLDARSSAG